MMWNELKDHFYFNCIFGVKKEYRIVHNYTLSGNSYIPIDDLDCHMNSLYILLTLGVHFIDLSNKVQHIQNRNFVGLVLLAPFFNIFVV